MSKSSRDPSRMRRVPQASTSPPQISPQFVPRPFELEADAALPATSADLETRLDQSKGGGEALADSARSFIEPRMGVDFSHVRVHTDSEAVQMNQRLGARAFTHGQDIYFGAGEYRPNTDDGKRLLTHELTHVEQQTGPISAGQPQVQRWGLSDLWDQAKNVWNQAQDWLSEQGAFQVHDPDARIRSDPPELKFMGERIPQGTQVKIVETHTENSKKYVRVQSVSNEGAEGAVWGWTLSTNLSRPQRMEEEPKKTNSGTSDHTLSDDIKAKDFENLESFDPAKTDITKAVLESIETDLEKVGESSAGWFDHFVDTTFLGKSMKHPVHRIFAAHLKNVENHFMEQTGTSSPSEAAKKLGLVESMVSGGRVPGESEGSTSMHVFGLAIDVDYNHNPWIAMPSAKGDKTDNGPEAWSNTYYKQMQALLGGEVLEFKRDFTVGKKGGKSLDDRLTETIEKIAKIDTMVEDYFSLLEIENDAKLQDLLSKATSSPWLGKTPDQAREQIQNDLENCARIWGRKQANQQKIIRESGITNLSEDVIRGMNLYWGGMFGDLMHFDMRDRGIGAKLYNAIQQYKKSAESAKGLRTLKSMPFVTSLG